MPIFKGYVKFSGVYIVEAQGCISEMFQCYPGFVKYYTEGNSIGILRVLVTDVPSIKILLRINDQGIQYQGPFQI